MAATMISVPVSTHVQETAVLAASPAKVWAVVASGLSFWNAVESAELTGGASSQTLDATTRLVFKDGTRWTTQLREISGITKSVSFEVITCEPASAVTSMIHTIRVHPVTTDPSLSFVEWVVDFSNDATAAIVLDSSFKRREGLKDLETAAKASA